MTDKVIPLDELEGPLKKAFQELMDLVPAKDRDDKNLQRLVAIRLKLDGEDPTRDYILRHMDYAAECSYKGSLFEFLKNERKEDFCGFEDPGPPDEIG